RTPRYHKATPRTDSTFLPLRNLRVASPTSTSRSQRSLSTSPTDHSMSGSGHDLHEVVLRWPHADANKVIATGTFDQASQPDPSQPTLFSFRFCFSQFMPSITTGLSFRLPSFSFFRRSSSSSDHPSDPPAPANPFYLTFQWSSSLHLRRSNSGFEAPVRIPWQNKLTYKFVVDGRWAVNDAEPTEYDHSGFINNVYVAPPKPEPQPEPEHEYPTVDETHAETASETTAVESEPATMEKVLCSEASCSLVNFVTGSVKQLAGQVHEAVIAPAVEFERTLDAPYEAPTPATKAAPPSAVTETKQAQEAVAQVAPASKEVEQKAEEIQEPTRSVEPGAPAPEKPLRGSRVAIEIVPILPPRASSPEAEGIPGSAIAPSQPAEPESADEPPSTHAPALRVQAARAGDATKADAEAVATSASEVPVIEITAPAGEPAPELAPPVLAAEPISQHNAVKEAVPADAVATAPAPVEAPASAIEEVKGEDKVEAPEVLATPSVEEGVGEGKPAGESVELKEPEVVGNGTAAAAASEAKNPEEATSALAAEPSSAPETNPGEPTPLGEEPQEIAATVAAPETSPTPASEPATNGTAAKSEPAATTEAKPAAVDDAKLTPPSSPGKRSGSFTLRSKKERVNFPSEGGESISGASSRFSSIRKKRNSSIFGKIKGIFGGEKDKEKKEVK
ncbi:hypothetical protein EW146_g6373, partial [Bondarzewia mesenterica]